MKNPLYFRSVKLFVIFVFILLPFTVTNAANADKSNIKSIVKGWLKTCPPYVRAEQGTNPFKVDDLLIEVRSEDQSEIVAYVYNLKPTGYVIVSPDERMNPIIAYSTECSFNPIESDENHLLALLRRDILERKRALDNGVVPPEKISSVRSKRKQLETAGDDQTIRLNNAGPVRLQYDTEYGPYLSARWGQDDDYWSNDVFNLYTPYNYVCGCVATAMSQIMYYYQWPIKGTGSHSYTWNNGSDPPEVLSVDYSTSTYDWNNMIDYYYYTATTSTQREAAGLLTYQAGVAVNMNYTSTSSGASHSRVPSAFEDHFRMEAIKIDSNATFFDKLYENMENSRPAMMGISRPGGGHSIVVDGVRHNTGEQPYFHLNLGWNGSGYYSGDPDNSEGWYNIEEPIITSSHTYQFIDDAVINIIPVPFLDNQDVVSTHQYSVTWDVPSNINATYYELQYAYFDDQIVTFIDSANNGLNNWTSAGHWEITTDSYNPGSEPNAFRGFLVKSASPGDILFYSTLTLNKAVFISTSTTINYYWSTHWFNGMEARLEISTDGDGSNWDVLKTHTAADQAWTGVTITSAELSGYHNQSVMLRWAYEYSSGGYYDNAFYFDDFSINNGYVKDWVILDSSLPSNAYDFSFIGNGPYAFQCRAYCDGEWRRWSNFETIIANALEVTARVYLEGAYEAGMDTMRLDLNTGGYLPAVSPYAEDPVTCSTIPDSIADWVLVELRSDAAGPAVEQRSALLSKHGYICNTGGTLGILFDASDGEYYIVIRHRDHLPVMSALKVGLYR
jgi:hypothetical protein